MESESSKSLNDNLLPTDCDCNEDDSVIDESERKEEIVESHQIEGKESDNGLDNSDNSYSEEKDTQDTCFRTFVNFGFCLSSAASTLSSLAFVGGRLLEEKNQEERNDVDYFMPTIEYAAIGSAGLLGLFSILYCRNRFLPNPEVRSRDENDYGDYESDYESLADVIEYPVPETGNIQRNV